MVVPVMATWVSFVQFPEREGGGEREDREGERGYWVEREDRMRERDTG